MIKLLIFDLDGTLLDTSDGVIESALFAAETLGQPRLPREELLDFIGPPLTDSFPKHYGFDESTTWEAIRLFRQHYQEGAVFLAKPYDGIYDLCRTLQDRGIAMAVATNKIEPMARKLLARFGFDRYCSPIRGADAEGNLKKSDLIRLCLKELNVRPQDAVLMGDTVFDAEGAADAGVHFLAVTYGFGFRNREDAEVYADAGIAATPMEAAEILEIH
jgi:phosphoglycolate phosphatase